MLLLEQWERRFLASYQVAVMAGVETPRWSEEQARLDAALEADPQAPPLVAVDSEQMELRRALGVA